MVCREILNVQKSSPEEKEAWKAYGKLYLTCGRVALFCAIFKKHKAGIMTACNRAVKSKGAQPLLCHLSYATVGFF